MTNKELKRALMLAQIPEASPQARADCVSAVKTAAAGIKKRRASVWYLIKVQLSYVEKGSLLSAFFIAGLTAALLSLLALLRGQADLPQSVFAAAVATVPLCAVPMLITMLRSQRAKMAELEAACKYNLQRLVAVKMLINGIAALTAIVIIWLVGGIIANDFAPNRLLLSAVSYNVTLTCVLCFGKRSAVKGFSAGAVWGLLAGAAMGFEKIRAVFYALNCFISLGVLALSLIILTYSFLRYSKSISFETEAAKWSLKLTN